MMIFHNDASARQIPYPYPVQVNDLFTDRVVVVRCAIHALDDRPD
jgi:hypothetical protein